MTGPKRKKRGPRVTILRQTLGGTWYGKWRDPITAKSVMNSLKTQDKATAKSRALSIERSLRNDPAARVDMDAIIGYPVSQAVREYLAMKRIELPQSRNVRDVLPSYLKHFERGVGANVPCADLTVRHITMFTDGIAESPLSPSTRRAVVQNARRILKWLHDRGAVDLPLAAAAKMPPDPRRREVKYLSNEDVRAAIRAARQYSPDAIAWVLFAVTCGLRAQEICHLIWRDIDLDRGTLIVQAHDADPDAGIEGYALKASESRRSIPIGGMLLTWLRDWRRDMPFGPYVLMHPTRRIATNTLYASLQRAKLADAIASLHARIETRIADERAAWSRMKANRFQRYREFPRRLGAWIRANGCPDWDCNVSRHTFATVLARQGEVFDEETGRARVLTTQDLKRLMGHASVATTERHYLAHFNQHLRLGMDDALGLGEADQRLT